MPTNKNAESLILPADGLDWDLAGACNDCPFRKSTPAHIGVCESIPFYINSIDANIFCHTCHKTDNREGVDGPRTYQGKPKHCYGALVMLLKTGDGKDLQLPLLRAVEDGKLDLETLSRIAENDSEFFTLREFLGFYGKWLRGKIREAEEREEREVLETLDRI